MIKLGEELEGIVYEIRKSSYGILYNELGQIAVVNKQNWGLILPGGEREEEEHSLDTVKRETLEEIGYQVEELEYFDTIESYYEIDTSLNEKVNCHNIADIYIGKVLDKINNKCEKDKTINWYYPIDLLGKMKLNFQNAILDKLCENQIKKDLIYKITDEDFGLNNLGFDYLEFRYGARGIVIREDGKIALLNKANKNAYKLPGGGIEDNETPEEAFKREILEETGCIIDIFNKIGTTEEYKTKIKFKQVSHIFVGKVMDDTHKLNLTQKEKEEGAKLVWVTPQEGLKLINECYDRLKATNISYSGMFVVLRDKKILELYISDYIN